MPDATPNPGPELIKAVHEVMVEVAGVDKDGHMSGAGNYDYASIEGIIVAVRGAMIQAGLTLWPTRPPQDAQDFGGKAQAITLAQYTTSGGSPMNLIVGEFCWKLCHTSGEWDYIYALGDGADGGDKAAAKAQSAALKVALLHTFLLPRGNVDGDATSSDGMERGSSPAPASTPRATAARPNPPPPREESPLSAAVGRTADARKIPRAAVRDYLLAQVGPSGGVKEWAEAAGYHENDGNSVEEIALTLMDQIQEQAEGHPDDMPFE